MYSIVNQIGPIPTSSYVPYFYQGGVFQRYGLPATSSTRALTSEPNTLDQFSFEPSAGRSFRDHQTVEQIIANGYFAIPAGDSITAILSDKKATSWLGLDDIIGQVRDRYEIYHRNMYELELAKCAATNALYAHWAYQGTPEARTFYARHKRVQELYEQQREERLDLWKDVSRLRLALPESSQNYLSAHRKLQALEITAGEDL